MEHFKRNQEAEVVLILTNNPQAYVYCSGLIILK